MLIIDARKIFDAGIGTYLRELTPRVLKELPGVKCEIWLPKYGEAWFKLLQEKVPTNLRFKIVETPPLSLAEQYFFRKNLSADRLFWATSLAHPLFFKNPYIVTLHDVAQLALPVHMAGGVLTKVASKVYFQSILNHANQIVFVSEFSRSEFSRYVGTPKQSNSVIHLGVGSEWFVTETKSSLNNSAPYFISVSSIRPHKNFSFLLRAFLVVAELIPHDLVIVGDIRGLSDIEPELMKKILGLKGRIKFLGRVSDIDLKKWVVNASAMIFPSLYEGFGLPPIEAMAAGCPVIASSSAAIREVCGDVPVYFNPRHLESLTSALSSFVRLDSYSREMMIAKGRVKALEYDWSTTAHCTAIAIRKSLNELLSNNE